jgi:phosphatidylinositol alpha-mannosyltransferase
VVASNLDAFRRVLADGKAGRLVPVDDPAALAEALIDVLVDAKLRVRYVKAATAAVHRYDWSVVADDIMRVYETVAVPGAKVRVSGSKTTATKTTATKTTATKTTATGTRAATGTLSPT